MSLENRTAPPRIDEKPHRLPFTTLLLVAVGISLAAVLYVYNPQQHGFYPFCMFHRLTGFLCPGCGGLRAAHQLLHGNIIEAFRLNMLFVSALPFLAWQIGRALWPRHKATRPISNKAIWATLALLLVFGLFRNIFPLR